MASLTALTIFASILGPVMVLFVVMALATDHWIITDVDMTKLTELDLQMASRNRDLLRIFYSRNTGLFRQCYPDVDAAYLDDKLNVVSGNCFYISYAYPSDQSTSNNQAKSYVMQAILATYVIGMLACVISLIFGFVLCFSKHARVAFISGATAGIGSFMLLMSLVMFHTNLYYEGTKIGGTGEIAFHNTWNKRLLVATSSEFGYSYALAWVGIVLAALDTVIYMSISRLLGRKIPETSSSSSGSDIQESSKPAKVATTKKLFYDYPMIMGGLYTGGAQPSTMVQGAPFYQVDYGNGFYSDSGKFA